MRRTKFGKRLGTLVVTTMVIGSLFLWGELVSGGEEETLAGPIPTSYEELWKDFDPRAEPLDLETVREWREGDTILRIVRFKIGQFKGEPAWLAGVYGYPEECDRTGERVPGLLQIHGGGQYADAAACIANAKRGYATLSIAWAGRISATEYLVSPREVKLFWDEKTEDPSYRLTTDWGALDGYHAPARNEGNQFPSIAAKPWTFDEEESPRNSGWFLCALAGRRALTFLEQQHEVDPDRIGVYGHSMGGKLTVMIASDDRVKAAAPSCGGISDRYNSSPLFQATLSDDVSLERVDCPILFLSPANDFHGRIGDLPDAIDEIKSKEWRVVCSPHHNHQDTPQYEAATLLWFDEHLQDQFSFPKTPSANVQLGASDGVPLLSLALDADIQPESIEVYYTQHGDASGANFDLDKEQSKFWFHARCEQTETGWQARLPLETTDRPLWVFANATYRLAKPVAGAGYYYRTYQTEKYTVSSVVEKVSSQRLKESQAIPQLQKSLLIEDFTDSWDHDWFAYREPSWARTTNKLRAEQWKPPVDSTLAFEVRSDNNNSLLVVLGNHMAEIELNGGADWQEVRLKPEDFLNFEGAALSSWEGVHSLKFSPRERLRAQTGDRSETRLVGAVWQGEPPAFRQLRWLEKESGSQPEADSSRK